MLPAHFSLWLARQFLRSTAMAAVLGVLAGACRAEDALPEPYDIKATAEHPRSSEGSFVVLHSGRILFDFSQFSGGQSDYSNSAIAEIFSDDDGRSWSAPREIIPTGSFQNVMSVSLLRLQSGKLARFYCVKRTKWLDCHPLLSVSSDEGATWSEAQPVTTAPGYFVLNNDRVIQTATGRILVPLAFHRSRTTRDDESAWDPHGIDLWYYSDDEGHSWHEAKTWWALPVESGSGLQEPGVVQLADGSLFSWSRTDRGVQYSDRSQDNGVTWTAPVRTSLYSPESPASIKRLPNSSVLMAVYNDHSGRVPKPAIANRRAPLAVAFSTDNAQTWGQPRVIESDLQGWYCYTAICFTREAVLLAYSAGDDRIGHLSRLRVRRIPLALLHAPAGAAP